VPILQCHQEHCWYYTSWMILRLFPVSDTCELFAYSQTYDMVCHFIHPLSVKLWSGASTHLVHFSLMNALMVYWDI
jgi:hypothetical protein